MDLDFGLVAVIKMSRKARGPIGLVGIEMYMHEQKLHIIMHTGIHASIHTYIHVHACMHMLVVCM